MDFPQTVFTDTDTPAPFADSLPITINITVDTITEGLEYFQARIVETSDWIRVRIGQRDTVNVTINDDDSELVIFYVNVLNTRALVVHLYFVYLFYSLSYLTRKRYLPLQLDEI